MTATANSFQPNFINEQKPVDIIQKDVKKWVDSVVKFKASLEKKKIEPTFEKHLKKVRKIKIKKRSTSVAPPSGDPKTPVSHDHHVLFPPSPRVPSPNPPFFLSSLKVQQVKSNKPKKIRKSDKSPEKHSTASTDKFDEIKDSYRTIKLPSNWTSGISGGRIVFNRIKFSTLTNSQQKMSVERSLVITKDCNTHVLMGGSEIILNNWEMQKVATLEDVKKAIRDVEALKLCEGSSFGSKSPQCFLFVDNQNRTCPACKSEPIKARKIDPKNRSVAKKPATIKRKPVPKQKSPK